MSGFLEYVYDPDEEPNPFYAEGVVRCMFVVDGKRVAGTAVIRRLTEKLDSGGNDFELYFNPDSEQ